jgi:hypothetical protein
VSEQRWIMVGDGTPQMLWVGKTTLDDTEIDKLSMEGRYMVLDEARCLRTVLMPNPQGGIIMQNQLTPAGICRGAATIRVKPASYIWPDEDQATMGPLMEQVKNCSQSELKHRAKEAGIELAGANALTSDGMRSIPGGNNRGPRG